MFQDGFVAGPEIRFDIAPMAGFNIGLKAAYDYQFRNAGWDEGIAWGGPGPRHPFLILRRPWWPPCGLATMLGVAEANASGDEHYTDCDQMRRMMARWQLPEAAQQEVCAASKIASAAPWAPHFGPRQARTREAAGIWWFLW